MGNNSTEASGLFRQLRLLRFDIKEKESHRENLLDVLEIVAVAVGDKPAHLNGQGLRSPVLLSQLDEIAARHGLHSLRTHPVIPHVHRLPRIDSSVTNQSLV